MRPRALVLVLAACGSAPAPTTTPTTSASPTATDEDWRGTLNQLTGPTCKWIPDASFVVCKTGAHDGIELLGWEPHNRRYVLWAIDHGGLVRVLPGTVSSTGWTFESTDGKVTLHKDSDAQWTLTGDGGAFAQTAILATAPGAVPAAKPAGAPAQDWRARLQPFEGEWTFEGTSRGEPLTFTESCKWITGAMFIACKLTSTKNTNVELVGYEPHNARFVRYLIDDAGETIEVLAGTKTDRTWTFTGARKRATMTHETGIRTTFKSEVFGADNQWATGIEGAYTTQVP